MSLEKIDPVAVIRERKPIYFEQPSMTKQSEKNSVDLNQIVAKYLRTGDMPGMKNLPAYGDFTASKTLHESMNLVKDAEAAFATLPASVRDAVGNDPAQLLDLVADPSRRDEAIELGLVEPPDLVPEPVAPENPPTVGIPPTTEVVTPPIPSIP